MTPFLENLAHFMHGAAFMFFLFAAVQLYPIRNKNRVVKFLFFEMVFMVFLELKDAVFLTSGIWDSNYIPNLTRTVDMWFIPTTGLFLLEILSPGWVNAKRAVTMITPSVLFTFGYALFPSEWLFYAALIYSALMGLVVLIIVYMASGRYDKYLKRNFSNIETLSLGWVRTVVTALFVSLFVWTLLKWVQSWGGDAMYYTVSIVIWVYIYYYSTKHSVIEVPNVFDHFFPWQNGETPETAVETNGFPFADKLSDAMDKKIYLNPGLTLTELAAAIGTNRTYLSEYLNNSLDTTFYEYLNGFRVREARGLLEKREYRSLEEIAERSGFNSLSTFRRSFIKETGTTPARYIEHISKNT